MSRTAALALAALAPAIIGGAPAAAGRSLLVPLCSEDGQARLVRVPLDVPRLPGSDPASCCVKGCHAAGSRKRGGNQLVP
jgi:hypothetical protein